MSDKIAKFFGSSAYAVAGASNSRDKFGNKVLRCYLLHHKIVHPINPNENQIEQLVTLASVAELPDDVKSLSIVTPPTVTEKIVEQAIQKGIENIWMQPGAESPHAIELCTKNNINVIANGPCILVELGWNE